MKITLCFVLSGGPKVCPFFVVGGKGSPFTTVTSLPVSPPLGPFIGYCPDSLAISPGLCLSAIISLLF